MGAKARRSGIDYLTMEHTTSFEPTWPNLVAAYYLVRDDHG
jgi:hypothetical protein